MLVEAYRVVYRVDKNSLLIFMILYIRRDLESLLFDLLITLKPVVAIPKEDLPRLHENMESYL